MPRQPLFAGLVFDEFGSPADSALVGDEPCYVVDNAGFRRHISSEQIDRQVLNHLAGMMKGSEDFLSEQTAKMIDEEISKIIETQYERALHILSTNKDKLDALAAKLLEKEVIFREDLEEVFGVRAWDPELTEHPVSNTHPDENETPEKVIAPESGTQL